MSVITLTFGDMAENHVGMEQIGEMANEGEGFHLEDFVQIKKTMEELGATVELVSLSDESPAHVLIIRNGVKHLDQDPANMFEEHQSLDHDKKAFMYGRVVNKHARWNLCYDEESREPNYEEGKGRIIGYDKIPLTKQLKDRFHIFGPKAENLKIEGNYYYDVKKCGIGFHGDSERRKVIGVRLGDVSLPLHFQWYHRDKPIGEQIIIDLHPGDIYLMCEKAVGTDWKKKTIKTLRHSTGCAKYTMIKEKWEVSGFSLFQEALDNCRWKKYLEDFLKEIELEEKIGEYTSFEEIVVDIYQLFEKKRGLGMTVIYDIVVAICRYHKIAINKVYIIGNGLKRAIKILRLKTKVHKIGIVKLNFVELVDVVRAFALIGIELSEQDVGDVQSYLCKWQLTCEE
jgi:hypothetical protein